MDLAEGLGSIPSTHLADLNCHSRSRGSNTLFWSLQTLYTYGVQTYKQASIPTYNTNKPLKKRTMRMQFFRGNKGSSKVLPRLAC